MKILFASLIVLLLLTITFFITYPFVLRKKLGANIAKSFLNKIKRISKRNDYPLLDNINIPGYSNQRVVIDYLLCGEKYVYIINTHYIDGILSGKEHDNSWIYLNGHDKVATYVDNMLAKAEEELSLFSFASTLDKSLLVSINVTNNMCSLLLNKRSNNTSYIIKRHSLTKLIKKLEANNIAPMNKEQLLNVIEQIKDKNEKERKQPDII